MASSFTRVLVLEFNELSPVLMQRFIAEGKLPNFKKLRESSDAYVTTSDERQEDLEPWIQWPTIHTGLRYSEHQLGRVGEGHKLAKPRLWDVAGIKGKRSLIFGSMNIGPTSAPGILVPDPWTTNLSPSLPELRAYTEFVGHYVQEHTNEAKKMTAAKAWRFLKFMATHGLRLQTVFQILRQLLSERFAPTAWKRVAILDALQFDVFTHYFRKTRPDFSTFFLNSTAHLQHMHWRNLDPSLFAVKPSSEEQKTFAGAVLFGYQNMDRLIGRFMKIARRQNVKLVLATALSQQACTLYENIGGKRFCRPIDFAPVVKFAGVQAPFTTAPVMAEEFYVHFNSEREALEAEPKLAALRVGRAPAFMVVNKGASLFLGCKLWDRIDRAATLDLLDSSGKIAKSEPFFDYFYQIEDKKSGMHHPDGMFWMSRDDGKGQVYREKLPLTEIAGRLLQALGVAEASSEGSAKAATLVAG
ncbi:MAG: hypothetical protein ACXWPM_08600 [Bdellovibrionota bacterium]